jgi:hypothetical protein
MNRPGQIQDIGHEHPPEAPPGNEVSQESMHERQTKIWGRGSRRGVSQLANWGQILNLSADRGVSDHATEAQMAVTDSMQGHEEGRGKQEITQTAGGKDRCNPRCLISQILQLSKGQLSKEDPQGGQETGGLDNPGTGLTSSVTTAGIWGISPEIANSHREENWLP